MAYEYHAIKINGKKYDEHRIIAKAETLGFNMVVHHYHGGHQVWPP